MKIGIIDYNLSNISSVTNVISLLGYKYKIITKFEEPSNYSMFILPGVGSFKKAMINLKNKGLDQMIYKLVSEKKKILGICLGMQLFFNHSEEDGGSEGLNLIDGKVYFIEGDKNIYRVPNIGWRYLNITKKSKLLDKIDNKTAFYFVHSLHCKTRNRDNLLGIIDYSQPLDAVIQSDNIFATQFHPEKSQKFGVQLLKNFIDY